MGLKPLGGVKRKRLATPVREEVTPEEAPPNKKTREEPALSAQKVFNVAELRGLIAEELITDSLSETISSLNSLRQTGRGAKLTEQSIFGLPELKKQVATLQEVLHKSVVHYALNVLKEGDSASYGEDMWEIPPIVGQVEMRDYACLEAIHARKDKLNDEETGRLSSVLRARPELYVYSQSFALTPANDMPQATGNLLKIENVFNRSVASLAASKHAKDMTDESKRHVNNAILSVTAATRLAPTLDGEPDFADEQSRAFATEATTAMMKYPVTPDQREAGQESGPPPAATDRPSTAQEADSPAQAIRLELPSSYDEVVKTLNEQAQDEQAQSRNQRPRVIQSSTSQVMVAILPRKKQPTLLVDIYQKLQRTLNDPNLDDFHRCFKIGVMARSVQDISPRMELERIRNASPRRAMDERGAGQGSIAD